MKLLMTVIKRIAIIGERSSVPILGRIRRIGARIGSVTWKIKIEIGFEGDTLIQESITRPINAAYRMLVSHDRHITAKSVNSITQVSWSSRRWR